MCMIFLLNEIDKLCRYVSYYHILIISFRFPGWVWIQNLQNDIHVTEFWIYTQATILKSYNMSFI